VNSTQDKPLCSLYLITPQSFDPQEFCTPLAEALDAGNIAAVQIRLKNTNDNAILRAARALLPLCKKRNTPLIINDRPDLAHESGCDGTHVGQKDTPYTKARNILGENQIVGVTCHNSKHLAIEAAENGADYVAFGAFFPTKTKTTNHTADIEIIKWWSELMVVPCVAIGGITPKNCHPLVRSGADFLAVISAVWDCPDGPGSAVHAFNKSILDAS
jgi:thiamine-phosphate pyrophosphorylase